MKRVLGILVLSLALMAPAVATATSVCNPIVTGVASTAPAPASFLQVVVNGQCFDLSDSIRPINDNLEMVAGVLVTPQAVIVVNGLIDSDPVINFGATTTNLVAGPVTYSFLFSTPIVPGLYNQATSTGGVTVTNGLGGTSTVDNSGIHPTFISGHGTVGAVPTNLGVDIGTNPCTSGPGTPFTVTEVCNQGNSIKTFPLTFYDNLEVLLTYTQTDLASVASWSGAVTLNTVVPEPASISLLAIGAVLVALGYRARARRPRA